MTTNEQLIEATANRDAARIAFQSARTGSKTWREAEEDLTFWQGKVATLERMI